MGEHEGVSSSSPGGTGTTGEPRDPGGARGPRGSRGFLALAGLVAGVAGIAVSHTVTMLLTIRATPLLAVAEAIIEVTPGSLAEGLIAVVGQYDKPLLIVGVSLCVLALSAWAGVLSARSRLLSMLVFLAMGAVAVAAVWTRPGSSVYDVLPVVAGTATWVVVLGALADRLTRLRRDHAPDEARRRFLVTAGVVAGAAVAVGLAGQFAGRTRRGVETARRLLRLPVSRGIVPPGAEVGVTGVAPWRTSNQEFYRIDTAIVVPTVDPTQWTLRIHGMVDNELVLTYRDLLDRQVTEAWVTLCCVSNEVGGDLIGNAWWSGVRVAGLLAEAGVRPGADAVLQTSQDGWNCGTPLEVLTDDRDALLAIAMNGEPLPVEHGFPVRMVVPGLYGYVSATKWLVDLEVTRFADVTAYWTERGWSPRGPVKTQSRIDVPRDGADVATGTRRVGGVAWAQHTGVERVEVRLDGQAWQQTELGRVPGVDTWVQWSAEVDLGPGPHTLAVRATDRSGYTQTAVERDVVPDGATGWHTVEFEAG
ncbi:molybdopterin-dependent oxidoreductase [Nocardioides sp. WL0053]|uniref:Molybdopterin-dependent oxidoreductase n=1 Tax=Nocardioides jiangsuensis TaxID=2866161 RepID=A0ABS7RNC2_9ACTN|nr:molybdopterin-dependent oxidoreductase [Nocardioides jiangsuensis]